jgi:integrase
LATKLHSEKERGRLVRADLTTAPDRWLDEAPTLAKRQEWEGSDFLAYRDSAGRFLDFHSLRHGFISFLVAGGVHPKTAQRLARHGSIGLTLDRYTHLLGGNEEVALGVLPDLGAGPAPANPDTRRKTA